METETHQSNSNNEIQQNILSTTDGETAFFRAIIRYRPRGWNRHFSMIGICKDLERELQVVIPSNQIWNTLNSCYHLDLLAEMEPDDPDDIDRSKPTIDSLCSNQSMFKEFQLPIHPSIPPDMSFLKLVNERRLETSSNSPSTDQPNIPSITSPRNKRTTINSSLKLHLDQRGNSLNKNQNQHIQVDPANVKTNTDRRLGEDGVDSDLTEQEDYEEEENDNDDDDDDDDEKDDNHNDEEDGDGHHNYIDEEEEEESSPEPKIKKLKTSKLRNESNLTTTTNDNNEVAHSSSSNIRPTTNKSHTLARSNRSRNKTRWKK